MKKPSIAFWVVLAFIGWSLGVAYLGGLFGANLERTERGETMTLVQVQAWCTYANAVDYHNSGATEQQVIAALPQIQEFCGKSINHFLRLMAEREDLPEELR
jgi:hypothetical protein